MTLATESLPQWCEKQQATFHHRPFRPSLADLVIRRKSSRQQYVRLDHLGFREICALLYVANESPHSSFFQSTRLRNIAICCRATCRNVCCDSKAINGVKTNQIRMLMMAIIISIRKRTLQRLEQLPPMFAFGYIQLAQPQALGDPQWPQVFWSDRFEDR